MSIRIEESEIPSFSSLGFDKQLSYAWPYHPASKLLEIHMERHFLDYKQSVLDVRLPNHEVMKKRWWKSKFRAFIRKELRGLQRSHYVFMPTEEKFFEDFPHLRSKWELHRTKIVLRESRNDRFGHRRSDFTQHLRLEWLVDKKYEFMMRWLGLRTLPATRRETRKKYLSYYSDSMLYCHHPWCWWERVKSPLLWLRWLALQAFYLWNSSAFDIHVKSQANQRAVQHN